MEMMVVMDSTRSQKVVPGLELILLLLTCGVIVAAMLTIQRPHMHGTVKQQKHRWPELRVNINTASEAELTLLPGIGPRMAERIVQDRLLHGSFAELGDLKRVRWVGPVIVERLSHLAEVQSIETN
jgi:competence ComEA-like helix-hairpin-helix protein